MSSNRDRKNLNLRRAREELSAKISGSKRLAAIERIEELILEKDESGLEYVVPKEELDRYRLALDSHHKALKKVLPDLKAVEAKVEKEVRKVVLDYTAGDHLDPSDVQE